MEQLICNMVKRVKVLSDEDLNTFKRSIQNAIELITGRALANLEDYHQSHSDFHGVLAPKSARIFRDSVVQELSKLSSMKALAEKFPDHKIANVIDENGTQERPEIYFRLSRPGIGSDVGCPHMDAWFHRASALQHAEGSTHKAWIAICVESGLNGLMFFPHADIANLEYSLFNARVYCDSDQAALGSAHLPTIESGEAFIFRDDVLHAGAVNGGSKTRVSVEVTFVPK